MWVWIVKSSQGGDPDRMAAKAAKHNVRTVIVKTADGRLRFPQFTSTLVARLKAHGLRVCAYQRVRGLRPRTRGRAPGRGGPQGRGLPGDRRGVRAGGQVPQSQAYMERLRARVGPDFPLGVHGLPRT